MVAWYFENSMSMSALLTIDEGYDRDKDLSWEKFLVNSKSIVFDGHFPEFPILPGVCLIESGLRRVANQFQNNEVLTISSMRLTEPLFPGDRGVIEVRRLSDSSDLSWSVSVRVNDKQIARFKLSAEDHHIRLEPKLLSHEIHYENLNDAVHCLPHRAPMCLIDTARRLPNKMLITKSLVPSSEPWFSHTDSASANVKPIMPPAMIIEGFLQSGALLMEKYLGKGALTIFGGARIMQLLGPVYSEVPIEHRVWPVIEHDNSLIVDGESVVDGRVVATFKGVSLAIRPIDQVSNLPKIEELEFA